MAGNESEAPLPFGIGIGETAARLGVAPSALRYYEDIKLVMPPAWQEGRAVSGPGTSSGSG